MPARKEPSQNPFDPVHDVRIIVSGREGEGGTALLEHKDGSARVPVFLPGTPFDTLVMLMRAKLDPLAEWKAIEGYVGTKVLAKYLTGGPGLPAANPARVVRYIFELRNKLAVGLFTLHKGRPPADQRESDKARAWARKVIATHPFLGYRVATPKSDLKLVSPYPKGPSPLPPSFNNP